MARDTPPPQRAFEAKWFSDASRPSLAPPSLRPPPPPIGDPVWSTVLGAFAGGLGGFVMLLAAQFVAYLGRSRFDFVLGSERLVARLVGGHVFPGAAFALPVVGGTVMGALLGFLSRRLLRILPRLLFFCLFLPILLLFVQAIVIRRFAPALEQSVPLGPLAAGTVVYAIFVAVVSPIRLR